VLIFRPRTLSAAGSPANLFRTWENGKVVVIRAGSGRRWPAWWMRFDPATSLWKTYPDYSPSAVPKFLLILPRWGLMRSGVLFLRETPARRTSESASGSWPGVRWPTPKAHESGWKMESHMTKDGGPVKVGERAYNEYGIHKTWGLQQAIEARWPTPTAADSTGGPGNAGRDGGLNLRTAVGRLLNPAWVEALMGFPPDWTEVEEEGEEMEVGSRLSGPAGVGRTESAGVPARSRIGGAD